MAIMVGMCVCFFWGTNVFLMIPNKDEAVTYPTEFA